MEIYIDSGKKLSDIQHEFQTHFPFLKLGFFKHTHQPGEISAKADQVNLNQTIKELTSNDAVFEWHINGLMTVTELESNFQDKLNIGVHVFRKSGMNWLQTGATDNWTLAEQNVRGREMSEDLPKEEPEDYHEHE
jgi:hypothetical protein